jgi:glc operon protein GlcG
LDLPQNGIFSQFKTSQSGAIMKIFRLLWLIGLLLILGRPGDGTAPSASEAPAPPSNPIVSSSSLPLAEARIIIDGAVAYARISKMRMAVVVLDDGGHLISADRMDGTSFNSERQAKGKAFTSIISRRPSAEVADLMKTAPERFYGIMNMWPGQVYLVSGGLPLAVNNRLVGSVGVSGLPSGVDEKAAQAGIAAWEKFRESQKK